MLIPESAPAMVRRMSKRFREHQPEQMLMLPPSLNDWLPEGHLARFISDVVTELDLSAIYGSYEDKDGRGQAAYHPVMMVKLLLYGYCVGVASSRKIESATYNDIAFRYLAANEHPDHDSIAEFRQRHLRAMMALFLEVLKLCRQAGPGQTGTCGAGRNQDQRTGVMATCKSKRKPWQSR
jgi:transposase